MNNSLMTNRNQAKHLVEAKGPEIEGLTAKEILQRRRNKYLMVNVIARRARELNRGERSRVDLPDPHTNTELALAEVADDKMKITRKQSNKVLVSLIKND